MFHERITVKIPVFAKSVFTTSLGTKEPTTLAESFQSINNTAIKINKYRWKAGHRSIKC
jgi:hypothetical protein